MTCGSCAAIKLMHHRQSNYSHTVYEYYLLLSLVIVIIVINIITFCACLESGYLSWGRRITSTYQAVR